jgi:hypothetical protein
MRKFHIVFPAKARIRLSTSKQLAQRTKSPEISAIGTAMDPGLRRDDIKRGVPR